MSTAPQTRQAPEAAIPRTVLDDTAVAGARSYADALLNVAAKDGQAEAVVGELEEVLDDVLRPNPGFAALLTGPAMGAEQKDALLVRLFEGRARPVVTRFLRVLNRHGRLDLLETIVRQARAEIDRRHNRRRVHVRTAAPLDEGHQAALHDRLGRMLRAEPVIEYAVDPELIGGLVVQVGDEVYDASVRSQLERMRREIVEGRVHEVRRRFAATAIAE